ncbi:MAG: type II toxin-antitoxin system RelE/ParE family toxin [Alphaproteobacteria bacterium]
MIKNFKHKGLKKLFETGLSPKASPELQTRCLIILDLLDTADTADTPDAMNVAGLRFHELKHNRKGCFSVSVTGNYRITFEWDDGATVVDLEDYH